MVHMYVSPLTLQLKWEIRTYAQQEYITNYEFASYTSAVRILPTSFSLVCTVSAIFPVAPHARGWLNTSRMFNQKPREEANRDR